MQRNGRFVAGLVAGGSLIALIACSAAPPEKTPLVVCQAGENGCPKEKPADGKNKGDDDNENDDSSGGALSKGQDDLTNKPPTTPPKATPDGGADAGPTGPSCRALKGCCESLRNAKFTGSAAQCERTVADNNEYSCYLTHEEYKKPDDYYDPVCF
jgi:hypothetical protein